MRKSSLLACVLALGVGQAVAQSVNDPFLQVQTVVSGLDAPTTMAFLAPDDFLVLQKNDGRVRRVVGGVLQPGEVLDLPVDSFPDRGLLGIVVDPDFLNRPFVYLFYSEAPADGQVLTAHRVVRYTWDGASLGAPRLLLDLPIAPTKFRCGGLLAFGPDDRLYATMGDLQRIGKLQNRSIGPDPDNTGTILRIESDGTPPADNPFPIASMSRVFAYGLRNSFGFDFDPVTGNLWDTENGQDFYDEVNVVRGGQNSGWFQIQGPDDRNTQNQDALWMAPGAIYRDPAFSWLMSVGPTGIAFARSPRLGCARLHDVFVGDANCGNLWHFEPNPVRDGLDFTSAELQDGVADNAPDAARCMQELSEPAFGSGFGVVTDVKSGPDGLLYVVSLTAGAVYRIAPALPAALDADQDGVDDACDCTATSADAWSTTAEVPRLRLSGGAPTRVGWDSQAASAGPGTRYTVATGLVSSLRAGDPIGGACRVGSDLAAPTVEDGRPGPAPGEVFFYLVRPGNACGLGSYGRPAFDAASLPPC
ncbi:MAG TPA: PQQ-dependent sugar dehydrogenase [Candidatus Polarisedimenticolaceae bacterium]|nr:PQQ-dependent sugar dehydrogenase [Candidatus Polarisedimenticolaceae bacterium]